MSPVVLAPMIMLEMIEFLTVATQPQPPHFGSANETAVGSHGGASPPNPHCLAALEHSLVMRTMSD